MSEYTKITIEAPAEQEEELTMLLFEQGALGVAVDDPALIKHHLESGDWDASVFDAMQITTGRITLIATFMAEDAQRVAPLLAEKVAGLEQVSLMVEDLPDVDWQQKWKEGFNARPLGQNLLIRPCWDDTPAEGRTVIEIEPGMAFGTGDHATTSMVMELIERYLQPGQAVADLGCGSGILAITALKLGARQAEAVDIDPACAGVTERHCQLNGISEQQFHFYCGDIISDAKLRQHFQPKSYQLVLANINADIVCALAPTAAQLLSEDGIFICSGILDMYVPKVEAALAAAGLSIIEQRQGGGWNAYALRREKTGQ